MVDLTRYIVNPPTPPKLKEITGVGKVNLTKVLAGDFSELNIVGSVVEVIDDTTTFMGVKTGTVTVVTSYNDGDGGDVTPRDWRLYTVSVSDTGADCTLTKYTQHYVPKGMMEGATPITVNTPTKSTPLVITDNLARSPSIEGIVDLVPIVSKLNARYGDDRIYSGANALTHKLGTVLRADLYINDYSRIVNDIVIYTDPDTGFEFLEFGFLDGWTYRYRIYGESGGYLRTSRDPKEMVRVKPGTLPLQGALKKDPLYPPTITNPLVLTGILMENPHGNKDSVGSLKEQFPYLVLGL